MRDGENFSPFRCLSETVWTLVELIIALRCENFVTKWWTSSPSAFAEQKNSWWHKNAFLKFHLLDLKVWRNTFTKKTAWKIVQNIVELKDTQFSTFLSQNSSQIHSREALFINFFASLNIFRAIPLPQTKLLPENVKADLIAQYFQIQV